MWTIIKFITSLPTLIEAIKGLFQFISDWLNKRRQQEREEELKEAIDQAKKPEKTLGETQNAACELEKRFNPDSTCSVDASKQ